MIRTFLDCSQTFLSLAFVVGFCFSIVFFRNELDVRRLAPSFVTDEALGRAPSSVFMRARLPRRAPNASHDCLNKDSVCSQPVAGTHQDVNLSRELRNKGVNYKNVSTETL